MPDFQKIDPTSTYTVAEAAALKGVSYQSTLYAVHHGALRASQLDGRFLIEGSALIAWHPGRRPTKKPVAPGRER